MAVEIDERANGKDPVPDLPTVAGQLMGVEGRLDRLGEQVQAIAATTDRIARALGIESDKSLPPIRRELDSLHEEDRRLEKEVAETKTIVKVGMLENLPKISKTLGVIAVALAGLAALGSQVYQALQGK